MNERNRFFKRITVNFILITFNMLLLSSIVMGIIFFIMNKYELIVFDSKLGKLTAIIIFLILSVLIGTIISSIYIRKAIRPLIDISNATKRIAKGDFSVRVKEVSKDRIDLEINQLIYNFNEMVSKLSRIETLRSDFIASVSHEIKTPLSTIEGYVTLLEDNNISNTDKIKYINIIKESTIKLSTLTSNILKITKLENQEVEINKQYFNVSDSIRDSIISYQDMWEKKYINFNIDLDDVYITSDKQLLLSVWNNLISNAIKFSNEAGSINVLIRKKEPFIEVVISDNGIGMNKITLEHIFDKFYQADKSHSEVGSGLGLSIVRKIVTMLNGDIKVTSVVGSGSTFVVTLPIE